MAERIDIDLGGTVQTIQRLSEAFDLAWQKARRTGAPADLLMALDEASLALHRARIALSGTLSGTAIPVTPGEPPLAPVDQGSTARRTTTTHGQLVDVATG